MIKKALKLDPGNGYITDSLGWVYFKMGKHRKAIKVLKKAVKIVPQDSVIAEHLGDVYFADNSIIEALNMYKKALELDPDKRSVFDKIHKSKTYLNKQ